MHSFSTKTGSRVIDKSIEIGSASQAATSMDSEVVVANESTSDIRN